MKQVQDFQALKAAIKAGTVVPATKYEILAWTSAERDTRRALKKQLLAEGKVAEAEKIRVFFSGDLGMAYHYLAEVEKTVTFSGCLRQIRQEKHYAGRRLRHAAKVLYKHQRRACHLALQLCWDTDFRLEFQQRVEGATFLDWVRDMDEYEPGRMTFLEWIQKYREENGPEGLGSAIYEKAAIIESRLHDADDAWRLSWKEHYTPNYFGKETYPTQAVLSEFEYAWLTAHVHGAVVSLYDRVTIGEDEDGEVYIDTISDPRNGEDLSCLVIDEERRSEISELLRIAREQWGMELTTRDEWGNEVIDRAHFDRFAEKKDLADRLLQKAAGAEWTQEILDVLKKQNLSAANICRTWDAVIRNYDGKDTRPGQKKLLGQVHAEEIAALYQEELVRAQDGQELSAKASVWLSAGQKTTLTKIRNKVLRERAAARKLQDRKDKGLN